MTSIPKPIDPFARYTTQYNPANLLWAFSKRGSLEQNPHFQLTQAADGTIRVCNVATSFSQSTGIQEGFQLLELQGKDVVSDYPGGFEEICTLVQGSLRIQLIALKPSSRPKEIETARPSKNRKAVQQTMLASLRLSDGMKEIAKARPSSNRRKKNSDTEEKPKARSKRRPTVNQAAKLCSVPKKEVKKLQETGPDHVPKKYKRSDLLWACSTKKSVAHMAPFRLAQYPSGAIRIVQVEKWFQEATGVQAGQRVVQLQGKDIEAYNNGDLDEIQKVIQESLELNLLVLKRKNKIREPSRKQKRSSGTTRSETSSCPSFKPSPDEKSQSKSPSLSTRSCDWLKNKSKLIKRVPSE